MYRTSWGKWQVNGYSRHNRRNRLARALSPFLAGLVCLALAGPALGCSSLPAPESSALPAANQAATAVRPAAGSAAGGAATPGGSIYFPAIPKKPCDQSSAELELAASATSLAAGQAVTVTATLRNTGCLALGLPQYRLAIEAPQAVLTPTQPGPLSHSLGVAPGGADSAAFALQAVAAGQAVIRGQASFEVHQGYPGPAYWGAAASPAITVTVK